MIIAIDGPAAAGKSTIARAVAHELGLVFLDTGAMYRAVALAVLRRGVAPEDAAACEQVARSVALDFDADWRVRLDGQPVEQEIRDEAVGRAASQVSKHAGVRSWLLPLQRVFATRGDGIVAEGRDTATVVFPDAEHKFFLTASDEVRARRRVAQLGRPELYPSVLAELRARDAQDAQRALAPLRPAAESIRIDTDALSIPEAVAAMLAHIRRS